MHNGAALEASLASRTLPAEVALELSLPGVKEMEMSPCCKTREKIFSPLETFRFYGCKSGICRPSRSVLQPMAKGGIVVDDDDGPTDCCTHIEKPASNVSLNLLNPSELVIWYLSAELRCPQYLLVRGNEVGGVPRAAP